MAYWAKTYVTIRDVYNNISNPVDSNPSVFEFKNKSFSEYLDSK